MLQTLFIRSAAFIYLQFVQNQKQITDFIDCYSWNSCQLNNKDAACDHITLMGPKYRQSENIQ